MKKIIVFGATGGTGKQFVEQALKARHWVTAVLRNPDALTLEDPQFKIIKGDVFQPATFENAVKVVDVIVSCLGAKAGQRTNVYSVGVSNIVSAMQKAGVSRIICISAGAVIVPPKSSFIMKFVVKNILQRIFKEMYADMLRMEKFLAESNLNWTVIRAPRLTNSKRRGKYRAVINDFLSNPYSISRADLADYIVTHLSDEKTFKARVEVSY